MSAEYLAKAFFSKKDFLIITPDTHETHYDFIIENEEDTARVQVKAAVAFEDLIRFRNKHGSNNAFYEISDYDILAGVWVEESRIYLFYSKDINGKEFGESITVGSKTGRILDNHKRPKPYYEGII